jgi:hypothetical protein
MEQKTKKFLSWFLLYALAFSILTFIIDYLVYQKIVILKNILAGLIFGLAMSAWKLRSEKINKN